MVAVTSRTRAVPNHRGVPLRLPRPFEVPDPANLHEVREWVGAVTGPTAIDLFCGAGGLSLGLQEAGFSVLVGADDDATAVETHIANLRGLGLTTDLADPSDLLSHLDAWGISTVDLLVGGVPCQPFSRAGRSKLRSLVKDGHRTADDARAHLWDSFLSVARELRPRAVLLENVPDLVMWDEGAVLVGFREGLRELGYATDARVLESGRFGVPQIRKRLFVIGLLDGGAFQWPPETGEATLRDAIADLPVIEGGHRDETMAYSGHLASTVVERLRRGITSTERHVVYDHITRSVRPDDAEAFAFLKPGDTYDDLPERLRRYRSDIFTDKYKRLEWDAPSRSITAHMAKDGYWYIHPEQNRTLSIREAARLQTFPDWFRFAGHPTARYRQIGNAVPPFLGEALGTALVSRLEPRTELKSRPAHREGDFRGALVQWHQANQRRYPWRTTASPWHVLLAEMCLHRTKADQVVPVYERLVALAETPSDLLANSEEVLAAMHSLGLRWRAENVLQVARTLVDEFRGEVPSTPESLSRLPGVGDYVMNAVMCFAFGRRTVLLDTNTERIVRRVRGRSATQRWQLRLDLYELAGRTGPDGPFNFALLDLGGLICRAKAPACSVCPVNDMCSTGGAIPESLTLPIVASPRLA